MKRKCQMFAFDQNGTKVPHLYVRVGGGGGGGVTCPYKDNDMIMYDTIAEHQQNLDYSK